MRIGLPLVLLALAACGSPAPSSDQIVLTAAGASPSSLTVANGGQVHFLNKDSADHQIASSNCAELASPRLSSGQDFLATLSGPKSCSFSDALNPAVTSFQGTITVNGPAGGGGGGGGGY